MYMPKLSWLIGMIIVFMIINTGCETVMKPAVEPLPSFTQTPATLKPTSTSTSAPTRENLQMPTGPGAEWDLVVIGDSSLWGLGPAYADQIEKDVGVEVNFHNFALPNLDVRSVLDVLATGQSPSSKLCQLPESVANAEVVIM